MTMNTSTSIELTDRDYFDLFFISDKKDQKPEQIYVDVGTFNGDTVDIALKYNSNLKIVAIEPIKQLCESMKQRFANNNNITIVNKAAWNNKCNTEFSEYEGWAKGLSTLQPIMTQLRPVPYFTQNISKYSIECDTLDNILSDCNIQNVDYLKVDTEGSEEDVLSGFTKYKNGARFHIEFHIVNLANILQRLLEMNAKIDRIALHRDSNINNHVVGIVIGEFTDNPQTDVVPIIPITDTQINKDEINKDGHPFNRLYFEGGTYIGTGYQDFPVHYNTLKMILDRKPESVIDIGGSRGYVVKKLNDAGIPSVCMDVSEHCYHTRATDNFVLHDATKIPYPFKDKQFDLAMSVSVLEHIAEDKIPTVVKEIARISKRGFHGIPFEPIPNDVDNTHVTIKPITWWRKIFEESCPNYKYDIVEKEDTEKGMVCLPIITDNLIKLNICSSINMFHYSWQNIDNLDLNDFARDNGYIFKQLDVAKQKLPYNDNSVDIIISHFIERLTSQEAFNFLKECYRILKPNSFIRLTIIDTELIVKKYLSNQIEEYKHVNIEVENSSYNSQSLFGLLVTNNKTIYDLDSMSRLLSKIGFTNIQKMGFNKSNSKEIEIQTIDNYPTLSLYIEAIKDATKSSIVNTVPIIDSKETNKETDKEIKIITGIDRRNWILQHCKLGEKILDIGSTDGWIFRDNHLFPYVTSIDLDRYDLPNFYQMDAHNLKFNDKSFDIAVLGEVIEHTNDPIQVLKEAKRVSKRIIITVPDEEHWAKQWYPYETTEEMTKRRGLTLEQIAKVSAPNAKEFYNDDYKHLFHNRHYSEDTLRQDLEKAGITNYEISRLQYDGWSFFVVDTIPRNIIPTEPTIKGPIITQGPIIPKDSEILKGAIETKGGIGKDKLRVALISTPFFMTPPKGYSGLEMIIWDLACGLDRLGHDVTIFGPEGSQTTAHGHLVITGPSINTVGVNWLEEERKRYDMYKDIITPEKFDIVHDHTWFGFPYLLKSKYPNLKVVHTHHGSFVWESPPNW